MTNVILESIFKIGKVNKDNGASLNGKNRVLGSKGESFKQKREKKVPRHRKKKKEKGRRKRKKKEKGRDNSPPLYPNPYKRDE